MRVLMVERSPFLRLVFREVLVRENHETVGECAELDEAAAVAVKLSPDVVLLDLEGSLGGWREKIVNLRHKVPSARLIALGPPGMPPIEDGEFEAYLSKPCSPEAVLAAMCHKVLANGVLPA